MLIAKKIILMPVPMKNNLISDWLEEHGDPAIDKLVKRKNMTSADLAKTMGKQRSDYGY